MKPESARAPAHPAAEPAPVVRGHTLGVYQTNCSIVSAERGRNCWIVDAGFDPRSLIDAVKQAGLTPAAIVLTHAHPDHIAGVAQVRAAFPGTPIWIHQAEERWLGDPELNLSVYLGAPITAPGADRLLRDGDVLDLDGMRWAVLHTPGHSPGGITLYHAASGTALVGDTLFAGSIGRSDFPGSDHATLVESIRRKLYALPDRTVVYPGHGPPTTIGDERRNNPFVRG